MQRCQDETMPHVMSGGKSSQFLFFSCRTRKILSVPVKLQRRLKRIFFVKLCSPWQPSKETWELGGKIRNFVRFLVNFGRGGEGGDGGGESEGCQEVLWPVGILGQPRSYHWKGSLGYKYKQTPALRKRISGWQKLCEGTKRPRGKVWT